MPKNDRCLERVRIKRVRAAIPSGVIGLLLCASSIAAAQHSEAPSKAIHYTLSPLAGINGVEALEVEVRFVGNRQGQSTFKLPSNAIGGHERWRYLSHFEGHGVRIIENEKDRRVFLYRPRAAVTVRYRVRSAYAENPVDGNAFAGPVILPHWLATLGEFIFIVPEHAETTPVSFQWKPGSTHWQSLSNLDHPSAEESLTVARLLESSIIASPYLKVVERPIFGGALRMAAVGAWSVPLDEYADVVAKIASAQRAFWGDMAGPMTVTTVALADSDKASGGVGRYRGFAQYVPAASTPEGQIRVIAHEHVHSWIPSRLGEMPREEDEATLYWFSEGFTEFYTERTLLRAGIWTLEDFVSDLNDVLASYAGSPYNHESNAWTSARFWSDNDIQRIPYWRGNLFAYLLDHHIRQELRIKTGLDQLILLMRERWSHSPPEGRLGVLDNLRLSYRALGGSEEDLDALIESHITKGEVIRLPANLFDGCATVDSGEPPIEQAPQRVRLPSMDEQQRVVCAQLL
jgi:predicted metalloprotease with PDZ domain